MGDKCGSCSKGFRHNAYKLKCVTCNLLAHIECVGVETKEYQVLVKDKSDWHCVKCRLLIPDPSILAIETCVGKARADVNKQPVDISLHDVWREIQSLRTSLDNALSQFETQSKLVETLQARVDNLETENKTVKLKLANLEKAVDDAGQYARRNTLEIRGLPYMAPVESPEQSRELVKSVARALNVNLPDIAIDYCHRLKKPRSGGPAPIIVKFVRRFDKINLLNQRRVKRSLTCKHLDINLDSENPIYLGPSLTAFRGKLRQQANQLKNELGFKWLWVTPDGEIRLRKTDSSPVVFIENFAVLERLKTEGPVDVSTISTENGSNGLANSTQVTSPVTPLDAAAGTASTTDPGTSKNSAQVSAQDNALVPPTSKEGDSTLKDGDSTLKGTEVALNETSISEDSLNA